MSIVTISRGSYSRGKEVAEKVANVLNYECISRDILLEASEQFHIPEIKLIRAIHDGPRILDRFSHGKQQYIAFIRAAILKHMKKDNIVYHGLAGHFFLQDISHVLKVRVIADLEERVKEEMRREGIGAEEARYLIRKDNDELISRLRAKELDDYQIQLYGDERCFPKRKHYFKEIDNIRDDANQLHGIGKLVETYMPKDKNLEFALTKYFDKSEITGMVAEQQLERISNVIEAIHPFIKFINTGK